MQLAGLQEVGVWGARSHLPTLHEKRWQQEPTAICAASTAVAVRSECRPAATAYCRQEGNDRVMSVTREDCETLSSAEPADDSCDS